MLSNVTAIGFLYATYKFASQKYYLVSYLELTI